MEILFLKIRAVAKSVSSSFHSKRSQTLSNVISLGVPSKHLTQHILIFLFPGKSGIIHARWCGGARVQQQVAIMRQLTRRIPSGIAMPSVWRVEQVKAGSRNTNKSGKNREEGREKRKQGERERGKRKKKIGG